MDGLRKTWQEKQQYANDVIAFLSAFGLTLTDARSVLSSAYQKIGTMSNSDYINSGMSMAQFIKPNQPTNEKVN